MTNDRHDTAMVVRGNIPDLYNKNANSRIVAVRAGEDSSADYVPHISKNDVKLMAIVAGQGKRHGRRNAALIKTTFDGAFRISEVLGIRRVDLEQTPDGWVAHVIGKSHKGKHGLPGVAAISTNTVNELISYCYDYHRGPTDLIFDISRSQAYRIIVAAYQKAGIRQPSKLSDHVGACHALRHSGALERLHQTGNPRALQHQLRHKSAAMTLRYLKTEQADESIKIQQQVQVW
jgi:integrase